MIKIGNLEISNIKLGSITIGKVYAGDEQIYPNSATPETRMTTTYNVTGTATPIKILNTTNNIASMEVDGVEVSPVSTGYTFPTTGIHTVKYTLTDPTRISSNTFQSIYALKTLVIPDGVTSIGEEAFSYCSGLTSVNIPDSVTSIGRSAFYICRTLTSVTIPDSVTSIGQYAFTYCVQLASITVKATTPPSLGADALTSTDNCPIYVPAASVNAYKTAWSTYANRIQAIGGIIIDDDVNPEPGFEDID